MTCDWAEVCDGTGVIPCDCDCDHCQEDAGHFQYCGGCEACDPDEEIDAREIDDPTARAIALHRYAEDHNFVHSVSTDRRWQVCVYPGCLEPKKLEVARWAASQTA